jgi:hypothetical protein
MYQPARRNIVRERIIASEVMKLEKRQARERAAGSKSPLAGASDVRADHTRDAAESAEELS